MDDGGSLWRTEDRRRWFLIPAGEAPVDGDLAIRAATGGGSALVDRGWVARFETSEEEGRAWAKDELGATLGELRQGIAAALAGVRARPDGEESPAAGQHGAASPDALPAVMDLIRSLPKVIGNGLSGQPERLDKAKDEASELERRLREAGLDLGGRLAAFPDRLAGLRSEQADPGDDGGARR